MNELGKAALWGNPGAAIVIGAIDPSIGCSKNGSGRIYAKIKDDQVYKSNGRARPGISIIGRLEDAVTIRSRKKISTAIDRKSIDG
jgi:hypothetical protein